MSRPQRRTGEWRRLPDRMHHAIQYTPGQPVALAVASGARLESKPRPRRTRTNILPVPWFARLARSGKGRHCPRRIDALQQAITQHITIHVCTGVLDHPKYPVPRKATDLRSLDMSATPRGISYWPRLPSVRTATYDCVASLAPLSSAPHPVALSPVLPW